MKYVFAFFALLLATAVHAQTDDDKRIYTVVEQMPEYPGGQKALLAYLGQVPYPQAAKDKKVEGKVVMRFIVEKDGSVSNVEVVKGSNELWDKELIQHVQQMPQWKPGKQLGELVRVQYVLPVQFKL